MLILLYFCCTNLCHAQKNGFRHLTQREGLPTGFIYEIVEDDKGFIWIATNVGLTLYDGYQFTNFSSNDGSNSPISGNAVYDIEQYNDNTLLIASTAGLEIVDMKTKDFTLVDIPNQSEDASTAVDIEITEDQEIFLLSFDGVYHFEVLPQKDTTPQPKFYPEPSSVDDAGALRGSMALDNSNTLWISFGNKLGRLDLKSETLEIFNDLDEDIQAMINSNIWDVHASENHGLFITTVNGLLQWKKGQDQPEIVIDIGDLQQDRIQAASFQSITEDQYGNILLGTGTEGLLVWDVEANTTQQYKNIENNSNSINSNDVHYAFVDDQGITWLGYHEEGISLMFSNTFNYKYEQIKDNTSTNDTIRLITNLYEDPSGVRWFATENALVRSTENENYEVFRIQDEKLSNQYIANIHPIDEENLFLVTDSIKSFYSFNIKNKEFRKLSQESPIRGLDFMTNELEDAYLFGSENGNLILIDKSTYKVSTIEVPYPESYKLPIKPVLAFKNTQGLIDVFALTLTASGPEFKVYSYDNSSEEFAELPLEKEKSIGFGLPAQSPTEAGVYYIRLDNGILKLNTITGESELLYTRDSGVLSLSGRVGNITIDSSGYLWMSTPLTMLRLDPDTETISYYDLDKNRKPREIFFGKQLNNGNILYTGNGGYIEFNPEELVHQDNVFDIHITEISNGDAIFNTLYDFDAVEFDQTDNNLSISYLALNYKDPSFTKYRYRINGYSDEWVNVGTQQQVYVANIPPGNYTFEVQASPQFGSFSNKSAMIDFKIPPPWWNTWPAYLLYAFIFISGLIIFDRVQRRRVIAKERERSREKELKQAKEIEIAYENLKATQKKLIQSEKMASLGELTAGIAHEIQNPLNFVNNFAEINQELAAELEEEINKGELDEAKAIAKDIIQNELKIMHHGKRADSIVKGMLQHSRNNSGEKELTDINVLCDEYLRLAYHGLRAKDKSFNANLESDFDKSLEKVLIVPQDIGRVVLNIINNGLHAIKTKQQALNDLNYKPTIWVTTEKDNNNVIIKIKDNGNGIPDSVKDKIFQPFFTTKSAGEGTGLGLSMSYDIIRAHGGELSLDSINGKGTTFFIILPIQN